MVYVVHCGHVYNILNYVAFSTFSAEPDCDLIIKTLQVNYVELSKLSYNSITLFAKEIISFEQKKKMDHYQTTDDKNRYFLDDVLIPSLQLRILKQFNGFISMLQESEDTAFQSLADKINKVSSFKCKTF